MFRTRWLACLLFVISILCFGLSGTAQGKKVEPLEALRGKWRAEISATQSVLLEFLGDSIEMKIETAGSAPLVMTANVVVPKEHSDQHLDWIQVKSGERPLPDNKCLYKLSGDTLLLIGGGPKERPAQFYSGPGGEPKAFILTRVEPKAAEKKLSKR